MFFGVRVLELQLHEDKERYIREITRLKELHTAEISEMERVHQERLCIFKQQAGREQWRWCESQLENDTFLEKRYQKHNIFFFFLIKRSISHLKKLSFVNSRDYEI